MVKATTKYPSERILLMATLPQRTLDSNLQIKLSNEGALFHNDTWKFIFKEFDEKMGFSKTLAKHLDLNDSMAYFVHSNEDLLR